LVLLEVAHLLGLELAAIDAATLGRLSCFPFPRLPPQLFRIHIPDSMHAADLGGAFLRSWTMGGGG
jgi:hypothetical protein